MPADPAPELTMLEQVDLLRKLARVPVEILDLMDWYLCLDLEALQDRKTFEKAVAAHKFTETYIGPKNDRYLRALHQMRFTLDLFMKSLQQWRLAAKSMQKSWKKAGNMLNHRCKGCDKFADVQRVLESVNNDMERAQG